MEPHEEFLKSQTKRFSVFKATFKRPSPDHRQAAQHGAQGEALFTAIDATMTGKKSRPRNPSTPRAMLQRPCAAPRPPFPLHPRAGHLPTEADTSLWPLAVSAGVSGQRPPVWGTLPP